MTTKRTSFQNLLPNIADNSLCSTRQATHKREYLKKQKPISQKTNAEDDGYIQGADGQCPQVPGNQCLHLSRNGNSQFRWVHNVSQLHAQLTTKGLTILPPIFVVPVLTNVNH